jgi:hypothetical protein
VCERESVYVCGEEREAERGRRRKRGKGREIEEGGRDE